LLIRGAYDDDNLPDDEAVDPGADALPDPSEDQDGYCAVLTVPTTKPGDTRTVTWDDTILVLQNESGEAEASPIVLNDSDGERIYTVYVRPVYYGP